LLRLEESVSRVYGMVEEAKAGEFKVALAYRRVWRESPQLQAL